MKRLAAALVLAGCASVHTPPPARDARAAHDALTQAIATLQKGDLAAGGARLRALIASTDFTSLSSDDQHLALSTAAGLALEQNDLTQAGALLRRSTAMEQATIEEWQERTNVAFQVGDSPETCRSLTVLVRRWPTALTGLNELAVGRLFWVDGCPDAEARLDLLDALHRARWTPLSFDISPSWRDLTLLLLERKQIDRAREVAADVTEPVSLISMRVDNRFDAVVRANPEHFDIAKAQDLETKHLREEVRRSPRSMAVLVRLLRSLANGGQYAELLQIAEAAIREAGTVGATSFDDVDTRLSWVMYQRARALEGEGRWQEAVDQLADARLEGDLVSQAINLGYLYCKLDRPYDALNIIAHVTQLSPYGKMQLEFVRLLAAVELHDGEATARALNYLREHGDDAMDTLQGALVQAGHPDEAARLLVRRLETPSLRNKALVGLQNDAERPTTSRTREWNALWKAMVARPEIQAAIAKVGKVESFDTERIEQ